MLQYLTPLTLGYLMSWRPRESAPAAAAASPPPPPPPDNNNVTRHRHDGTQPFSYEGYSHGNRRPEPHEYRPTMGGVGYLKDVRGYRPPRDETERFYRNPPW